MTPRQRIMAALALKEPDCVPFKEVDHNVEGLFIKEVSPIEPTGLKAPILMVHGACHGWWAFNNWLPFFGTCGWKVYSMSLRNHTGSCSVPDERFLQLTVDDYAEDVLKVLSWLDQPVILMGHSMGGITVQKAAEYANLRALLRGP